MSRLIDDPQTGRLTGRKYYNSSEKKNDDFNHGWLTPKASFKQRHGMSFLVPVVLIGIFILLAVLISFRTCMGLTGASRAHVENEARNWASSMYPNETSQVICQNIDSDNNGYISCTIRIGAQNPMGIECAAPMSINSGCRIPPLQNMVNRTNSQ